MSKKLVGARGFEPPTSSSQSWRTTRLCNTPNGFALNGFLPHTKGKIDIYKNCPKNSRRNRQNPDFSFAHYTGYSILSIGDVLAKVQRRRGFAAFFEVF